MRILIVEDEPSTAELVKTLLAPLGTCEMAADGASALRAISEAFATDRPYRLVCLDIQLGDMEGYEVLRRLRDAEAALHIEAGSRTRVIMTTVVADPARIMAAFDDQCDAYVVKPITRERLYLRLRDVGIAAPDAG